MCFSNSDVELEIKSEHKEHSGELCYVCNSPATRLVEIGEVQRRYGAEWAICSKAECEKKAMAEEVKNTVYAKTHRRELIQEEKWNSREGK